MSDILNPNGDPLKPIKSIKSNIANRGFASMDPAKQREIASKGGKAAAVSDTSHRGFASMDPAKQREIASKGGRASQKKNGTNGINPGANEKE